ncbi:MAG: glycoside hydrolase family 81 [Planctomycetes bacterium]|nr:glycoside hydrolase family 81 [Planctomycetota bacterium]
MPGITKVGLGSYATQLPQGAKEPPAPVYKTADVRPPLPTNQWWSSLLWTKYSEPQYAHPLAVRATAAGLQVCYPGPNIAVIPVGIMGGMAGGGRDFVLGHSAAGEFPDARLAGWSDWFVTASFAADSGGMRISYGHGSPFIYATYDRGQPRLVFAETPTVWAGAAGEAVLGVTVSGRHYGLFGPAGATWTGLGGKTLECRTGGKAYFSAALLPDNQPATLALFRRYAYAHVTGTKVEWAYDEPSATVTTKFTFTTRPQEGAETGTLFALYPHQWSRTQAALLGPTYASVRGVMKLAAGTGFATRMTFPGVLPALPDAGGCDRARLARLVEKEPAAPPQPPKDTYWEGKRLGKLASLVPLAEQAGADDAAAKFLAEARQRLQDWFTATDAGGQVKRAGLFSYNRPWGTLIGYPASYGSDTQLNDHHFHYGYFLKAAAEVARHDRAWASPKQWGRMVGLVASDIAEPAAAGAECPRLRCFDLYAGHSWASGHARFADGNNQESSSESMNAWTALILWGQATGDRPMRDLGICLFTTEMEAINAYWFDVTGTVRPAAFKPPMISMVWGGKGVYETWFSGKPEVKHGINWLPFHGGSLYLGLYPEYVRRNYDALAAQKGGANWGQWADLVLMYRALDDPQDALRQFDARGDGQPIEAGNSAANAYHWIANLAALGHVDRTVTADYPLYAAFNDGRTRTYVVYNMEAALRTVKFSDGATLAAKASGFTLKRQPLPPRR